MKKILKIKDWVKSKEHQFTIAHRNADNNILIAFRIADNKRFKVGHHIQNNASFSIIIGEFCNDCINVRLDVYDLAAYRSGSTQLLQNFYCEINNMEQLT